jgi:hypothetical protein
MKMNSNFATISDVLVFKTNISTAEEVKRLSEILNIQKGVLKWNVDLNDIDNVLRIESHIMGADTIIALLCDGGYECEELPD